MFKFILIDLLYKIPFIILSSNYHFLPILTYCYFVQPIQSNISPVSMSIKYSKPFCNPALNSHFDKSKLGLPISISSLSNPSYAFFNL